MGPRAYHGCVVINYDIYIIGGFDGTEYFNSCIKFNAETKKWKEIAPMHCRRYVHCNIVEHGRRGFFF